MITTPLSSTWLSRSPSTSWPSSSSSSSEPLGIIGILSGGALNEVIRRPRTGEVESKTTRRVPLDDVRELTLESL